METKSYHCVKCRDLEQIIQKEYKIKDFVLALEMEWTLDTWMVEPNIQRLFGDEQVTEEIDAWISGAYNGIPLRSILVDMVTRRLLHPGNYLIEVS